MAVTLGQMDWRLGVDNAGFQSGLANAEKQARGFGANITKALATGAKVAFGAAVVGVGALGAVLAQSVKEASAAEEVTAQLNAVIKSTGGVAGVSAKAIQDHALALSRVTKFEDDAIVSADAMLLTFTNIGKDVFPQATTAILDVATAFKMDLESAAKMVGKALNDPVAGLTALSKAGVQFTEDQKAMIKSMVEAGDTAGAQALILKELEIQTGGSAIAAGKTMTGQMEIMKNALGNVKEEIGGALLPVLTEMLNKFGPGFIEGASQFADWFVTRGLPALQSFGQFIELQVYPVLDRFGKWFEVTILPILADFINFIIIQVIPALQTFGAWVDANIIPVLQKFGNWFELHIIPALKTLATFVVETVIPALDTFGKWVEKNIFPVLEKLAGLFMWSITDAIKTAIAIFETAKGVIQDIISFVDSLLAGIKKVLDLLPSLPSGGGGGGGYGVTPTGTGGGGYGGTPVVPPGGGGYGGTPTRGMSGNGNLTPITINVYAAGGGPEFVRKAANQGVNEALRSRGYR